MDARWHCTPATAALRRLRSRGTVTYTIVGGIGRSTFIQASIDS